MIFAITTWWIWRWRNDYVFNNVEKDHADKIRWIYTQATETRNAFRNTTVLNQNNAAPSTFKLTWEQPPDGWYVLNTDGSFGSGANNGSCAGVVRDSRGNWCGGFGFRIPATSVALTEAWAILKGVEWAWRKGFRKLIVQSDSKRVIDWIDGTSTPRGPICNIIEKSDTFSKFSSHHRQTLAPSVTIAAATVADATIADTTGCAIDQFEQQFSDAIAVDQFGHQFRLHRRAVRPPVQLHHRLPPPSPPSTISPIHPPTDLKP
nr:Non-LTR retroelement reverse transcriptase [Ipomoea batatas]